MSAQIWVLGGPGHSGRSIAAHLARGGLAAVLVGRDARRLHAAAEQTGSVGFFPDRRRGNPAATTRRGHQHGGAVHHDGP
ncbi:MAG: hypothetical protein JF597_34890 [Streptomyces sp.]|jgi:short subunit dehydrogenase-like uncharacterized protein|uniref:hypothetical protein n=1 Tax=Streptomyces sp. TaxID=1931 RepID=UPI0025FAD8E6|nr:hypothetical protein [Streptomyces sp.]MBW8798577.1 hypothetical protein [Streptomyces sp.]